jgi:hypothetical protein
MTIVHIGQAITTKNHPASALTMMDAVCALSARVGDF